MNGLTGRGMVEFIFGRGFTAMYKFAPRRVHIVALYQAFDRMLEIVFKFARCCTAAVSSTPPSPRRDS